MCEEPLSWLKKVATYVHKKHRSYRRRQLIYDWQNWRSVLIDYFPRKKPNETKSCLLFISHSPLEPHGSAPDTATPTSPTSNVASPLSSVRAVPYFTRSSCSCGWHLSHLHLPYLPIEASHRQYKSVKKGQQGSNNLQDVCSVSGQVALCGGRQKVIWWAKKLWYFNRSCFLSVKAITLTFFFAGETPVSPGSWEAWPSCSARIWRDLPTCFSSSPSSAPTTM